MQVFANGIIQGLLFSLMGLSFALVYNTTRTFHLALGGIYSLAPFIAWSFLNHQVPGFLGVITALMVCGAVGLFCEETLHWPFLQKSAPSEVHLIGSLGMFLVLVQVIVLIWGNETQVLRAGIDEVYSFADIRLIRAQVLGGMTAITTIGLFFFWLERSSLGLQFRAMADNPVLLSLLGRNVRNLRRLVFVISALMAALVVLAVAYDIGFDAHGGLRMVLVGMVATIVGGRGSFLGTVVAGLLLGIIRSQVVWYSSARWEEATTFLILAVILFFWPQGIMGRKFRLEEKA